MSRAEKLGMLLVAARHAHTALSFDVSRRTQRRAAENLALALEAFDTGEERDTLRAMRVAPEPIE